MTGVVVYIHIEARVNLATSFRAALRRPTTRAMALSYVAGPQEPDLWELNVTQLLQQQASRLKDHEAAVFPWQDLRLSYNDLDTRSAHAARSMLALGLKHGDSIGIIAGNRYEYIETFLGAGRIGCPFAVLNNTYSPKELVTALKVAC